MTADGFVTTKPRTSATPELTSRVPTTGNEPGIYEFVLKSSTKAVVTMSYDFCPGTVKSMTDASSNKTTSVELRTFFDSFNSTNKGIYKLNMEAFSKSDNTSKDPLGSLAAKNDTSSTTYIQRAYGTGVKIYPSNLTKISDQSIKVDYVIVADPAAARATYTLANFYRTCPSEILTIGDGPNETSQKWARGPFYGCIG